MNSVGLYGLGVMGKSLARNISSKGYSLSVFDINDDVVKEFCDEYTDINASYNVKEFVDSLKKPRVILLMVTAGKVVDDVIDQLLDYIDEEDIIVDCGNSFFKDTIRREKYLKDKNILYFGVGVSGGEEGALKGPCIMPGGDKDTYNKYIGELLESISAIDKDGNRCCKYIGPNGAGHYVKMVHNGIEYADMQIISEIYYILKSVGLNNEQMADIFEKWDQGILSSYLIEITSKILRKKDGNTDEYLVDKILDVAKQKGTGRWTCIEAIESGVCASSIEEALMARVMSEKKDQRVYGHELYNHEVNLKDDIDLNQLIDNLEKALLASKICAYAQGFDLIKTASNLRNWNLNLSEIASIWKAGCIIRADLLDTFKKVFSINSDVNLLFDESIKNTIDECMDGWMYTLKFIIESKIYAPCLTSAYMYLNGMTSNNISANLIQAQRDFFGAHTYERIDSERNKFFHTIWE